MDWPSNSHDGSLARLPVVAIKECPSFFSQFAAVAFPPQVGESCVESAGHRSVKEYSEIEPQAVMGWKRKAKREGGTMSVSPPQIEKQFR